jgi:hypothetical protein
MDEARRVGKLVIVEFPEVFVQLGREVHQHPALSEILENQDIKEFEIFIAEVASYCNFAMDGIYDQAALEDVAELCLAELQRRRTPLIM